MELSEVFLAYMQAESFGCARRLRSFEAAKLGDGSLLLEGCSKAARRLLEGCSKAAW